MNYFVSILTIVFAIGTLFSRKKITASFFFLLACCGVSACFFQLGLAPFALLLIFSSSFSLIVYFLFCTLLSEETKAPPLLNKRNRLLVSITILGSFILLCGIFIATTYKTSSLPLKNENLIEFWRLDFVQNTPFLLTYSLILIASLIATLFISWNTNPIGDENERI